MLFAYYFFPHTSFFSNWWSLDDWSVFFSSVSYLRNELIVWFFISFSLVVGRDYYKWFNYFFLAYLFFPIITSHISLEVFPTVFLLVSIVWFQDDCCISTNIFLLHFPLQSILLCSTYFFKVFSICCFLLLILGYILLLLYFHLA